MMRSPISWAPTVHAEGGRLRALLGLALLVTACSGDRLVVGGGGTSDCVPGTYAGTYECMTGTTDSGFLAAGNGAITMKLEGDRGGASLNIGPGAQFTGAQVTGTQVSDSWIATFSGSLDCASNKLTATLGDVTFTVGGNKLGTLYQVGAMSADYDAGAADADATPALVNGQITDTAQLIPGMTAPIAACTWTATLQP